MSVSASASTVQNVEYSLLLLDTYATDLSLRAVVFGVTLRLLVINISSSSPAINTAAYYQRCVITCETFAVVHRWPCLQRLACCSINTGSQAALSVRSVVAMHKRSLCRQAVSVFPSVCLSVTFVDSVEANKHIFKKFSPSGSHTILVSPYQTSWQCLTGTPQWRHRMQMR